MRPGRPSSTREWSGPSWPMQAWCRLGETRPTSMSIHALSAAGEARRFSARKGGVRGVVQLIPQPCKPKLQQRQSEREREAAWRGPSTRCNAAANRNSTPASRVEDPKRQTPPANKKEKRRRETNKKHNTAAVVVESVSFSAGDAENPRGCGPCGMRSGIRQRGAQFAPASSRVCAHTWHHRPLNKNKKNLKEKEKRRRKEVQIALVFCMFFFPLLIRSHADGPRGLPLGPARLTRLLITVTRRAVCHWQPACTFPHHSMPSSSESERGCLHCCRPLRRWVGLRESATERAPFLTSDMPVDSYRHFHLDDCWAGGRNSSGYLYAEKVSKLFPHPRVS